MKNLLLILTVLVLKINLAEAQGNDLPVSTSKESLEKIITVSEKESLYGPDASFTLNLSRYNILEQGKEDASDSSAQTSFGFEMTFDRPLTSYKLLPSFGFLRTSTGSHYVFTAISRRNHFTPRFYLNLSFGGGAYFYSENSTEIDLGHVIEFRTAISLNYEFLNKSKLGIEFFHLSNAGIGDENPGSEVLSFTYSVPISF